MISLFKKAAAIASNRTTYRIGLLQAKAYRILKRRTAEILKSDSLSTIEWAFLGLLLDKPDLRTLSVAAELGVKPPFITVMVAKLKKQGLVTTLRDEKDVRSFTISLTDHGTSFVNKTEVRIRAEIRSVISGVSVRDLLGYLSVLELIVQNDTSAK